MIAFRSENGFFATIDVVVISRLVYGLLSLPSRLRDRLYTARLRQYCRASVDTTFTEHTTILNSFARESVGIGSRSLFMGEINIIRQSARIRIGDWCFVGPGAKLWAMESIDIGDRVFISHGVQIFDNNSHSLSAADRHERFKELLMKGRHLVPEAVTCRPIKIEDDVWIGFNSAVMKGVTIGRGAVVGAGTMVTHDVAPFSIIVGNPARKVGESQE
jgi:acetyltransferase-like isoleucine patch superfamily enzyme